MQFSFRDYRHVSIWIIILMAKPAQQDDSVCKGEHKEVTFPRIIPRNNKQEKNDQTYLTLTLKWRQELLFITMESHDIVPGGAVSEWQENDNVTEIEVLQDNTVYYQGRVNGKAFSFIAVGLKDGLTGYMQINNEGVYIKPITRETGNHTTLGSHLLHSCGYSATPSRDTYHHVANRNTRHRRAAGMYTKYLEVLVVADTSVTDFVGKSNAKMYLLTLMNIVNTVYHDESLGAQIEVVTVKIMFMDSATEKSILSVNDPQRTVDKFCHWASQRSYRSRNVYDSASNHDVAVLLTRHKFAPAGYAPITGLCVPMRNCAFIKDDGFTSAFVIAHEIAHIFGLMHDGHGNTCHGREYATSIMATMVQSSFNHYWWSGCSKQRMAEVIGYLTCLNNNPLVVIKEDLPQPLGLSWSLDEQCRFEFGEPYRHCRIFAQKACAQMWCTDNVYAYTCKTKNVAPLEGSQCGPTPQWYCLAGQCGYHGNRSPVHGGWSQWTAWSNCSASCGIGFKRRSRMCDSPKPEFNGKSCDGENENSDICKADVCEDYEDQRSAQCLMMDIVPFRGTTMQWISYQLEQEADRCKLTCISVTNKEIVTFDTLVDNGIPCAYGDASDICMDGKCVKIGCDGIRGSDKEVDQCGVCDGKGDTCKTVKGVYNRTFEYSAAGGHYEKILVLPKGSRNIAISEKVSSPHLLSLQDTLYHQLVLNAAGQQEESRNFVLEGAWFTYQNNYGQETLISNGPLHGFVNVMIYPMAWKSPTNVEYSYDVDSTDFTFEKNQFEWKFDDWSPCSVTCGKGVQFIVYKCFDKHTDRFVDEEGCKYTDAPKRNDIECERVDCAALAYLWRMRREYSECSATCGEDGVYYQMFECERLEDGMKLDNKYCIHIPEPIILEPCNRNSCAMAVYKWKVTTTWTSCSATCGVTGSQHQLFHCTKVLGKAVEQVENLFCSDLPSPIETRPCNRLPCLSYRWVLTGEWLNCDQSCGDTGIERSKPVCKRFIGEDAISTVGLWYCKKEDKPEETRPCNRRTCFSLKWEITDTRSDCSHTCGTEGVVTFSVICKNVTYDNREYRVDQTLCDPDDKPTVTDVCNRVSCESYVWVPTSEWTECSSKCGDNGVHTQIYKCHAETSKLEVSDEHCQDIPNEFEEKACNRILCFDLEWRILKGWSPECPQSCNTISQAEQTREVACYQKFLSGQEEMADDILCQESKNLTQPMTTRLCNNLNCSVSYSWAQRNEWGPCSQTCGEEGVQTKISDCVADYGNGIIKATIADNCRLISKPPTESQPCHESPCVRLQEDPDAEWTKCSATCGSGVQQKQVTCIVTLETGGENVVDISVCVRANLTRTERPCNLEPCGYLEYGAGAWSPCSKSCGPGKQKRIVYCGNAYSPSDVSRCPGKPPAEYGDCENEPCPEEHISFECVKDRAPFCTRANARACEHPTYGKVCCKTCAKFRISSVARYRRHRHFFRMKMIN